MRKNHSADILGNHSAESLGFAYVFGGFGRHRRGRFSRTTRDFVPSSSG
jgi:hypothetical protein